MSCWGDLYLPLATISPARYYMFLYQLRFYCVFIKFDDSRHARLSIYAVFHEESDFEVKNKEIRLLDVKNEEHRNLNQI